MSAVHMARTFAGVLPSFPATQIAWISRQMPTVAFVTAVVAVLVAFRIVAALGFGPFPGARRLGEALATDFAIHEAAALAMLLLIEPVRRHGPASGWRRVTALAAATLGAAALAGVSLAMVEAESEPQGGVGTWRDLPLFMLPFAFPAAMLVVVGEFHRAEVMSIEAMRGAEASRGALEHETLQARLKTLEAQIEPHFLFNVLANVRRLYDTDASAGEVMLERLIRYFETALPSLREQAPTLEREAQLVSAYLDLQQVRMGRRLAFSIDIAAQLRATAVPPLMLLTLVENAIKHGIAPQREGGAIEIRARREGAQMVLQVADTGRGFGAGTSGGGTGLANIRARLAAMYGDAAELTLAPHHPRGLVATLRVPVR
jgi:signal transduction histidine kinase